MVATRTLDDAMAARGSASLLTRPRGICFIANGNSITTHALSNGAGGGFSVRSELGCAMQFADPGIFYQVDGCAGGPSYSTSYFDPAGNFGYPAQTLATIIASCQSTWFPILDYGKVKPDLVIGHALYENDIAAGATGAAIIARVDQWIALMRAKFPGVVLQICTSRPDGRLTANASMIAAALTAYAYVVSLDDGQSIFVTDLSFTDVLDPTKPWTPKAGYTWKDGPDEALTLQNGIHTRENAASINGRLIATTWKRIAGTTSYNLPGVVKAQNLGLTGSSAIASGKISGTTPTGFMSLAVSPSGTTAAVTSTALNPGWRLSFAPDPATLIDTLHIRCGQVTPSPIPKTFRIVGRVRVVSGASILGALQLVAVATHSDASTYTWRTKDITLMPGNIVVSEVFADGDEFTIVSQPCRVQAGKTVSNIITDVRAFTNGTGAGPLVVEIDYLGLLPVDAQGDAAAITPGASPYAYQNIGTKPQDVIVSGGTVSAVAFSRDGATYFGLGQTAGMFRLGVGDFLKVTYSVAPTMTAVPR